MSIPHRTSTVLDPASELEPWRSRFTIPPTEELIQTPGILHKAQEDLDPLDHQELLITAGVLEHRNGEMLKIENLRLVASPIQNIPPEILSAIFIECLGGHFVQVPPRRRGPAHEAYPWMLGHICSSWRAVLWSTPGIWENINILNWMPNDIPNIPSIIQWIVSQTKSPISLNSMLDEGIMDTILLALERFEFIQFFFMGSSSFRKLFQLSPTVFGTLESLRLIYPEAPLLLPSFDTDPLLGFPKIRRIYIKTTHQHINMAFSQLPLHLLPLPWSQLTHLTLIRLEVSPEIVHGIFSATVPPLSIAR